VINRKSSEMTAVAKTVDNVLKTIYTTRAHKFKKIEKSISMLSRGKYKNEAI
jgi:hypothetical protein